MQIHIFRAYAHNSKVLSPGIHSGNQSFRSSFDSKSEGGITADGLLTTAEVVLLYARRIGYNSSLYVGIEQTSSGYTTAMRFLPATRSLFVNSV